VTTAQAMAKPASRLPDHRRAALVVLACVLAVSCTGRTGPAAPRGDQQPAGAWPTSGWRTAAPQDQGMDPTALAGIDDQVRLAFPALRSVLVVRHGVLVFERYYHGATPASYAPTDGTPPSLVRAGDWVRSVLRQAPATRPGTRFAYSSAGSHLLSAVVADATGQPTLRYAQARLFAPLGIASDDPFEPVFAPRNAAAYQRAGFAWPTDPQGYHLGYGFLKLTARDLAKLGYLYLKGGTWEGRQVVPAAYVRASTRSHVPTGGTLGPFTGYGYQWWTTAEQGHHAFAAVGLGGQLIEVIPDLDLIVVTTAAPSTAEDVRAGGDSQRLVANLVVPAVRD
jgi:hypothetical protein